jgi:hypothetical protein
MSALVNLKTKNSNMKSLIGILLIFLCFNVNGQGNITLGSGNSIWLNSGSDPYWSFGKDDNHNINIRGYGAANRRFRILNGYDGQEYFNVNFLNGYVGIGTATPSVRLEVMGDISLPSVSGNKQIYTWSSNDTNWRIGMSPTPGFTTSMTTSHVQYVTYYEGTGQGFAIGVNGKQSSFEVRGSDHNAFFRGAIGVGTTNPGSFKLAVEGKIGAREVNVTTAAWSDYVFKSEYRLRSLTEVDQYIKENQHLPDVPSEKEVLKNGQDLGAMNAILLKKIEELTLYGIEFKKEIEALKIENKKIVERLKTLENQ